MSELLRFFNGRSIPNRIRPVSDLFESTADQLNVMLPPGAEKTVALRKLIESRDAAIRAAQDNTEV